MIEEKQQKRRKAKEAAAITTSEISGSGKSGSSPRGSDSLLLLQNPQTEDKGGGGVGGEHEAPEAAGDVEAPASPEAVLEADPDFLHWATVQFLPTTIFTFRIDLQTPVGFEVAMGRRGAVAVADVDRSGQAQHARLAANRCIIKRVGNDHVHTVEDLELGVLKRRIASALVRQGLLDKAEAASAAAAEAAAAATEATHLGLQAALRKKEAAAAAESRAAAA